MDEVRIYGTLAGSDDKADDNDAKTLLIKAAQSTEVLSAAMGAGSGFMKNKKDQKDF